VGRNVQQEFNLLQQRIGAYSSAVSGGAVKATRTAMQYFLESATAQTPQSKPRRDILARSGGFVVFCYAKGSRRRSARWFKKEAEARRHTKVDTRGLCKAGWWGSGASIGKPMSKPCGNRVAPLVAKVASMIQQGTPTAASFTAINRAPGMDRYTSVVLPYAIGRASNRLAAATRAELAKAKGQAFR
jgi:hypothetical protein